MKATIARALRKNYRQESPLDWGYMTFAEPRRERVRLTAQRTQTRRRGGNVKKILIQLDTDEHPSTFDAIVAHDADVDVLLRYGGIEPDAVRGLVQSAFFTRGPKDLATLAVWVGGSSVGAGEEVLAEVEKAFFGPFRVSAMLDSNGCNTTAATTVARLAARDRPEGPPRRDRGRGRRRPARGRAPDRRGLRGHGVGDPGRRASATSPIAARAA